MKARLIWWCSILLPLAALAAQRPNFLFILTDDQRWDAMGVVQREQGDKARFPWFKTPNLDRLAAGGVRFRNAFVVNSLCAPSRATFMTGRYGHSNGIVNNHTPFTDPQTVASLLGDAGYATGYIGKWHMGQQSGKRPTWGYSASFVGQGVYFNCPIEVNGHRVASTGWVDDVSTGYAIDFVRKNAAQPFLLFVGFKATHGPFEPPPRRAKDFEGETARPVPNLDVPAIYHRDGATPRKGGGGGTNLGYFRALAGMDDNVGRLLDELDRLGLASNTMVVFAGDNGYYLGEHGLGDKRTAYEESLRIPLLVRYPALAASNAVVDAMALNIDLCPTFLDFAGVAAPTNLHGRSWRPLLEQRADAPKRDAFFYCYFAERSFTAPMTTAVRTEQAKLIRYPGHPEWTEVFDLARDPYETNNLASDPAHAALRRELAVAYAREAAAIQFHVPGYADDGPARSATRRTGVLLDYRFDRDEGAKVVDASGNGCAGDAIRTPLAEGRNGGKARRFAGDGYVDVPKTAAQDPSDGPFSVAVELKADKPDGVVLARGGRSNGYLLFLEAGRPGFVVTSENKATRIVAEKTLPEGWTTLEARVTAQKKLELLVDGTPVAQGAPPAFIADDPNDRMQIGADEGSPVIEPTPPRFTGLIGRVTLARGAFAP